MNTVEIKRILKWSIALIDKYKAKKHLTEDDYNNLTQDIKSCCNSDILKTEEERKFCRVILTEVAAGFDRESKV